MAGCARSAWLTLGAQTVQLEDPTKGYFCTSLDLGFPQPREVVNNRPAQDGVDDRTALMGGRVVSASIVAVAGAGARIDDVADSFAPFMVPSARPVLHWILDRPGAAERTLTVRASGYSWPVAGPSQRDINLQWLAADPVARDPNTQTASSYTGVSGFQGRAYPLTFPRAYPAGSGGGTSSAVQSPGDVAVRPLIRVYGPVTNPAITFNPGVTGAGTFTVRFVAGYAIAAGHYAQIDCAALTAYRDGDPAQPILSKIDWLNTTWPALGPLPAWHTVAMSGTGTTAVTQAQVVWNDGYLT